MSISWTEVENEQIEDAFDAAYEQEMAVAAMSDAELAVTERLEVQATYDAQVAASWAAHDCSCGSGIIKAECLKYFHQDDADINW